MTLYLKYRPQDFDSLVGQSFIKESLQAAVQNDKTVGAYLFTGPRGTGKTSTARIFAKAINCLSPKDGNPCGACDICKAFAEGKLIDIIEIDAASYTGVDNIREIIERAQFQPTLCKYKVYIIDEVHMLSKGAFNALLKILEEPPKHVKFILATTDVHKVPETILSRCQRYDFRSISEDDMRERLRYVAKSEGIRVDDASLEYIIKDARGGLRNALTLFEQLIVNGEIRFNYIESTLGVSSEDEKNVFLQKILSRDTSLLSDYEALLEKGKNPSMFIKEILFLLQKKAESDVIENKNISHHIEILDILAKLLTSLKYSFDEVLLIKIALLKILSGYTEETQKPEQIKNISLPQKNPGEAKKEISKEVSQAKKPPQHQEIDVSDIEDIFGEVPTGVTQESPVQDIPSSDSQSISSQELISEVKKLGGKGAVIMSLKSAKTSFYDGVCSIACATKITKTNLEKAENQSLILEALQTLQPDISELNIS